MRRWLIVFSLVWLAGCASQVPAPVTEMRSPVRIEAPKATPTAQPVAPVVPIAPVEKLYVVQQGDTLFGIARMHNLNPRDLAAWNNLDDANLIVAGQRLRLAPPAPASVVGAGAEARPVTVGGAVVARPLDVTTAAAPAPDRPASPPAPPPPPAQPAVPDGPVSLPAPAQQPAQPAEPGIEWGWPAYGSLLTAFSAGTAGAQSINRGIGIAGTIGDPVLAAAAGRVIFVGVYPRHGNLVVLLHADGYSTVYAHNRRVLVKEGQSVERGQRIADLGDSDADQPKLHFELRHKGKPLDPLKHLPAR